MHKVMAANVNYNILSRPKRSIHSQRLVITEEIAKLYGIESTSESDEDFVPDEKKLNQSEKSDNHEDDNDEEDDDDEDNDDTHAGNDMIAQETKEDTKPKTKQTNKKTSSPAKKSLKSSIKGKNTDMSVAKPKRKYKKTKKNYLNQLKNDEYMNENKKLLEKLSSKSVNVQQKLPNTGPYVKYNRVLDESMGLKTFVVCNNQRATNANEDDLTGESTSLMIKIPKDKFEMPIKNANDTWLCKLCNNRPNHHSLGDLYGPYLFKLDNQDEEEDVWVHESCTVWSPNVYISNNKLYGLTGVIDNSQKMVCGLKTHIVQIFSDNFKAFKNIRSIFNLTLS